MYMNSIKLLSVLPRLKNMFLAEELYMYKLEPYKASLKQPSNESTL